MSQNTMTEATEFCHLVRDALEHEGSRCAAAIIKSRPMNIKLSGAFYKAILDQDAGRLQSIRAAEQHITVE